MLLTHWLMLKQRFILDQLDMFESHIWTYLVPTSKRERLMTRFGESGTSSEVIAYVFGVLSFLFFGRNVFGIR